MQVRKLIRLLNEMVEKDPSLAYKEACVDRRYAMSNPRHTFISIPDVEIRNCIWKPEETENEIQRDVVVLGNY